VQATSASARALKNTNWVPYALILPSMVFLLVFFVWPLAETIVAAFTDSAGQPSAANLQRMWADINFRPALRNTLILVAVVVPLQVMMALAMATLLQQLNRGRMTALYIWTIPLGISDLAAGIAWLAILDGRGYLPSLLHAVGLVEGPVSWLSYQNPVALFVCVVVAELWRATAIVLVIIVAGMQLIPKEYVEAAEVFGAKPWRRFFSITLPLLKPSLQTALILRTVLAFEVFAVVYALSGRDLPVLVGEAYNWQQAYQNTGVAATIAILILILSLLATLAYLRLLRVRRETLA
jgi:multiple sugar transport system permease protein